MIEPTTVREHEPHTSTRLRRTRVLVVVAAGALLVAACGSSATKASTNPASNSNSTAASSGGTSSSGSGQAVAKIAMTKKGNALVDTQGMTLYTLTNNGKAVACTGACASAWPPLTTTAATVSGSGVTGIATAKDANGTQVTDKGLPLYRFAGDTAAGDANGDGLTSFGGTWHIVTTSASGAASTPAPAPAPATPTTASSSGGGYGY
ncbi:MAG TPA: hypothetical protein VGO03_13140 [Acidimicrobiia bacterium]|jgi:predicted lipoprotein with Yx(FWY)xxD motif